MIYKIYSLIYGKGEDNMIANYNVELLPYASTGSFRFWCQKVLPLVYDNSLSYYELLCKVVTYLNEVIQNSDNMNANIQALNQAFNDLQDYVNHYFDEFNMQQYVNAALDEMVDNGTMGDLIEPYLTHAMDEVHQAILDQNQSLNDSITAQNETISDALDEVETVVNGFDDRVDLLETRMQALMQNYSNNNTTIINGGSGAEQYTRGIDLGDTEFEFLEIYYSYGNVVATKEVEGPPPESLGEYTANGSTCGVYKRNIRDLGPTATPIVITLFPPQTSNLPNTTLGNKQIYKINAYYMYIVSLNKIIKVQEDVWYWDGVSLSSITMNSSTSSNRIIIDYVACIRNIPNVPGELADIRVGYNGQTYVNAGDAVRTQFNDVVAQITALQNSLNSMPKFYYGYIQTSVPDTQTKEVYITSDNPNTVVLKAGDILYLECRSANTFSLAPLEFEIQNDDAPTYRINRQFVPWNSYDVLVLRFDGTEFQFISKSAAE